MSGGSSKSSSSSGSSSSEPKITNTTVPAFMPGFDSMIAQQLGAGGYGDPNTLLAQMQAIQTPLQVPSFNYSPANPATTTPTKQKGPLRIIGDALDHLRPRDR